MLASQRQHMAEKVSGLIALGTIATLLCFFIPAATYTLYRTIARRLRGGSWGLDLVAFLVTITTLGAMVYVTIDAQQRSPRCEIYGGGPDMLLCSVERYDKTGPAVAMPRDQATALMRSDLLADVAQCVIIPSALGIAVLLVLLRAITAYHNIRTPNNA